MKPKTPKPKQLDLPFERPQPAQQLPVAPPEPTRVRRSAPAHHQEEAGHEAV